MDRRRRELERRAASGEPAAQVELRRFRAREGERIFAVIGCVHSNLEALEAVLADIAALGVERVICLGDVVGYGPDPEACLDRVQASCELVLLGNHEEALVHGSYAFSLYSRQAIEWSRPRLGEERLEYLRGLLLQFREAGDLFVHGSPRDPTCEYILPEHELGVPSVPAKQKYDEIFAAVERRLFVAHSHQPNLIAGPEAKVLPITFGSPIDLSGLEKSIVNVGSVGQPRDRDTRACWVLVEGPCVTWRRVPYDLERTVSKIEAIPELNDNLGLRLQRGV